jgi:hypothetical protein
MPSGDESRDFIDDIVVDNVTYHCHSLYFEKDDNGKFLFSGTFPKTLMK